MTFQRLLLAGVAGWLAAGFVLLGYIGMTAPERPPTGVLLAVWSQGWLPGGAVLLGYGGLAWWLGRTRPAILVAAAAVYLLPPLALAIAYQALLGGLPLLPAEAAMGGALTALSGPTLVLLYLVGLSAASLWGHASLQRAATAAALPPVLGITALLASMVWTGLTSPEAQDRRAFDLEVREAAFGRTGLEITADLGVHRSGEFRLRALYLEMRNGSWGGPARRVEWDDGAAPAGEPGRYRVRMLWPELHTDPTATDRTLFAEIIETDPATGDDRMVREFRIPLKRHLDEPE